MKKIIIIFIILSLVIFAGCQKQKDGNIDADFSPESIKTKVVEILSEKSLSVEIVEKKTDKFKVGDIVKAEFTDSNKRAMEIIEGLNTGGIIQLHYVDIDNNYEKNLDLIKCDGLDVYDVDGNEIVIFYR
ncbi:MAG: hypothetical protein ACK4M9_19380 [Anaerobacillus sp.]|uniref:hypothetical protein n=1 Tax=Anaerobacillus sp. TaxID=1872506 RepID=UPI00391CDBBD